MQAEAEVACDPELYNTEEDRWGVENVKFCTSAACVQRLARRAISVGPTC